MLWGERIILHSPFSIFHLNDAHGTNAEWYDLVCSYVFSKTEQPNSLPIPLPNGELVFFKSGVNTNAYYFVDVVAERGPAPIHFNSSHPADLFSPGPEVFAAIDGIGPGKSAAFVNWCADPKHLAVVEDLLTQVTLEEAAPVPTGGRCAGLTFVVTGDVHHYPNRDALKAYVESQGGKVAGSVSSKTNFLINNDVTSTSGKNKKAKDLGIPIISEDDFLSRFVN